MRFGYRDFAQLGEFGRLRLAVEGAGDQHVEAGLGRICGRLAEVGPRDRAELASDQDAGSGGRARTNDYGGVHDRFVFKPGVTELTGQVWLESDGQDEGDEYFAVELFLGEGWKFKPDATGIITILYAD